MAGHAILWRGLVEEHRFVSDGFGQFMTLGALDVLVGAAQGEGCAFVVIEQGRLPLHAVVAVGAGGRLAFSKLFSVDILVAILTEGGGRLEIHINELGLEVWRLVAVDACSCTVRPEQGKLGLGMVETGELLPRLGGMAGLATRWGAVGADLLHTLVELTLVDILVATGAVQRFPVINDVGLGLELGGFLVAIGAGYGDVAARQHKARLLVLDQVEGGRLVSLEIVALVAGIEVGRRRELAGMTVGMAVRADVKLDLVQGVLTLGSVALFAF